ncbi:MAG TPA: putative glycoside hydrolase [Nocardioides sp.]|nr:putative glycoside hydrolase [Nocardioides sp.]
MATALAIAALLTPQVPAIALQARPASHRHVPGTGVLALDWGDLDETRHAAVGDYVVMQPWEWPRIPAFRREHPGVRILMYKDASATADEPHDSGLYPTGVSYPDADAHHPDWFLTDDSGTRLEWADYPGLYPMDVGSSAYQEAWADHVLTELRAHDWDGVMLDDTLTYLSHPTVDDRTSVQIPDDASMYDAMESFLAQVAPQLRSAGYLAIPNLTVEWDTWSTVLPDWSGYVSGWENEFFVKWGLDRQPRFEGADWEWKMRMAAWCAVRDLPLLAVTYSSQDDTAAELYHRATWLLTWNGRTGASIFVPDESDADHWQHRANLDLGKPAGPRSRLANGVYRRAYAGGLVVVNPTPDAQDVDLGGTYERLGGARVTEVRLAPTRALLLRRVGR